MIPSTFEIHDILFNEQACKQYLIDKEIFYNTYLCNNCGNMMRKSIDRWRFRCSTKLCKKEIALSKGTFFEGAHIPINQIMFLAHLWLNEVQWKAAVGMSGMSDRTITKYYSHFRKLVASMVEEESIKIGGPGVIVEIDETKLGKRKYNRGHRVDGIWVIVGVERTPERRVFLVPVLNRNSDTCIEIIRNHVIPGSVIYTDGWRGYSQIQNQLELQHYTVNHSQGFIDLETGVHTNTVEGTNSALKRKIPIRNRVSNGISDRLFEFIWRRQNVNSLWESFILAIKEINYELI
jgi:transposase-like protein